MTVPRIVPSPNIWHWPAVYETENEAQDIEGRIPAALERLAPWDGLTVVDVGCGSGYHLPGFATSAHWVIGVEPHPPLVQAARERTAGLPNVEIRAGHAESLPLDDASVDIVHARTAYFFGAGCGAGISEAMRVLKRGGCLVIVDLDVSASPYGDWMRADLPHYDPAAVEAYFEAQGFSLERVDTRWQFENRDAMRAVLGIEFTRKTAARAARSIPGLHIDVRYRVHRRIKPAGVEL